MAHEKVLIYHHHQGGLGSQQRILRLAEAMAAAGFQVLLAAGGAYDPGWRIPSGISIMQLAPLAPAGRLYQGLAPIDPTTPLADVFRERSRQLVELAQSFRPDAVIVEQYPFGRRLFKDEVHALLESSRAQNPLLFTACSCKGSSNWIRADVRLGPQDANVQTARAELEHWFDEVWVHSDPAVISLDREMNLGTLARARIVYTGFVGPDGYTGGPGEVWPVPPGAKRVLVSAGSGKDAHHAIQTGLAVLEKMRLAGASLSIRIAFGPALPADAAETLREQAAQLGVDRVVSFHHDFQRWLACADLSISMAGFTAFEGLALGVFMLLIPRLDEDRDEQLANALALERAGIARVIRAENEMPADIAAQLIEVLNRPERTRPAYAANGAQVCVDLLQEQLRRAGDQRSTL